MNKTANKTTANANAAAAAASATNVNSDRPAGLTFVDSQFMSDLSDAIAGIHNGDHRAFKALCESLDWDSESYKVSFLRMTFNALNPESRHKVFHALKRESVVRLDFTLTAKAAKRRK